MKMNTETPTDLPLLVTKDIKVNDWLALKRQAKNGLR